mgnify:CR=1 FL=1
MGNKQVIICIGRQFGSGGHEIGEKLSRMLGISFIDRKMLDEIVKSIKIDKNVADKYKRKKLFSRQSDVVVDSVGAMVNELQFDYINEVAENGTSFVIVGRLADQVLKGRDNVITIFITGDMYARIERIMRKYNLDLEDAKDKIRRHDKNRKQFHNSQIKNSWGNARRYDLCINSSKLGIDGTVKFIEEYLRMRNVI